MKKQLLLLTLFLTNIAFSIAQITLENTYDGQIVDRYKLAFNGELYFGTTTTTAATFNIYNSNHTVFRQIPLVGNQSRKRSVFDIAETPNGELRFLTSEYDSSNTKIENYYLSDANGHILLRESYSPYSDSTTSISFLKTVGLMDRLVITISDLIGADKSIKLYDLNGNNLKMLTNRLALFDFTRINLEVSGEKFYQINFSDSILFYNADLSLWKKVKLPIYEIVNISQKLVNSDTLVEVLSLKRYFHFPQVSPYNAIEDSAKLIATNELEEMVSSLDIPYPSNFLLSGDQVATIYDDGSYNLYLFKGGIRFAKTFPKGYFFMQSVGRLGKKYLHIPYFSNLLSIYNEDLTLWKTIKLPVPIYINSYINITMFIPENSNLLHLAFTMMIPTSQNIYQTSLFIINETGNIILSTPNFNRHTISQQNGLVTKLLIWNDIQKWTKVYNFSASNATTNITETLNAQVSPNPFDKTLTIKLNTPHLNSTNMLEIQIFDLAGKQILIKKMATAAEVHLIGVEILAKGIYFLKITDSEYRQVVIKIVKD